MKPTWIDYFTSLTVVIGFIGIWIAMRNGRAANFVSAYEAIIRDLQKKKYRYGRGFFMQLQSQSPGIPVPRDQWAEPEWWEKRLKLIECAKAAYEQFDIAAILVWHSKIPKLLEVFIAEYQDSIIACWEQGTSFLQDRVLQFQQKGHYDETKIRKELYHSFSVIYIMAKHRASIKQKFYPSYSLCERLKLFRRRKSIVRDAYKERNRIIKEALCRLEINKGH